VVTPLPSVTPVAVTLEMYPATFDAFAVLNESLSETWNS